MNQLRLKPIVNQDIVRKKVKKQVNEQVGNEQLVQQKNSEQNVAKLDSSNANNFSNSNANNNKGLFTFFSKSKNPNNQEEGNIEEVEQNDEYQLFKKLNTSQNRLLDKNMNLMKEFQLQECENMLMNVR